MACVISTPGGDELRKEGNQFSRSHKRHLPGAGWQASGRAMEGRGSHPPGTSPGPAGSSSAPSSQLRPRGLWNQDLLPTRHSHPLLQKPISPRQVKHTEAPGLTGDKGHLPSGRGPGRSIPMIRMEARIPLICAPSSAI